MSYNAAVVAGQNSLRRVKREVEKQVAAWAELLALQDYSITIGFSPDSPNSRGQCAVDEAYRRVRLDFDAADALLNPDALQELIVHELVHVMLWPLGEELERWTGRAVEAGAAVDAAEKKRLRGVIEAVTTRLSRALVRAAGSEQ